MIKEIKYYQNYLSMNKNLSNKSIESYTYDLLLFERYLSSINKSLLKADNEDIDNFYKTLTLKSTSFNRLITSLKSFYKFLLFKNYDIKVNIDKLKHVRRDKIYPKIIKFSDIANMINANDNSLIGIRNKTIISLLYITGLRVSELINLTYNNVNLDEGYIRCIGKGNKEKVIVVGDLLSISLSNYTNNIRNKILNGLSSKYIFVNSEGDPLSRQCVYDIVKNSAKKAGIKLNVSPHTLRHCFATHMIENGADIRSVQEMLGHSDISTTQVYLNIAKSKIKEDYFNKFIDPLKEEEENEV